MKEIQYEKYFHLVPGTFGFYFNCKTVQADFFIYKHQVFTLEIQTTENNSHMASFQDLYTNPF